MIEEQPIAGYITKTTLDTGEEVIYGLFETREQAHAFGLKLVNHIVYPIYPPSLH
jgi:hypothetical protein